MSLLSAMQSVKNLMLVMVVVLTTLQSAQCQGMLVSVTRID